MKRILYIATVAFSVLAVSCNKEIDGPAQHNEGLTVHASLQPVNATKAVGQYSYNILWEEGDKISVSDASEANDTFTLLSGEGTTEGTFRQDGSAALSSPLTAYYPASIAQSATLEWPSTQTALTNIADVPMTATSTITSGDISFDFKHLGAVLQLVLTAENGVIDIKQIDITADQNLSGAFTVEDGVAVISDPETESAPATITTGDISDQKIKLAAAARYLNFAVPAGDYTDFKITITGTDDEQYYISAKNLTLERAMVNKVTFAIDASPELIPVTSVSLNKKSYTTIPGNSIQLTATVCPDNATDKGIKWVSSNAGIATVDESGLVTPISAGSVAITVITQDGIKTDVCEMTVAAVPDDAVPGLFSIGDSKIAFFAKGNLTYNVPSGKWGFFEHQYDCISEYDSNNISHFYWSKTASVAFAVNYADSGASDTDVFFTNATETTANPYFTVGGVTGKYRTLSSSEWQYLLNTSSRMENSKPCYSNACFGVTIEGKLYAGLFIYPDNYNGDVVSDSMTWNDINNAGIIFLPSAGDRVDGGFVNQAGGTGRYWSSTSYNSERAYNAFFFEIVVNPAHAYLRKNGHTVRLITESN